MLGTTSLLMKTRKGLVRIGSSGHRPSARGRTGHQSFGDEPLDWLDRKLKEIDQHLKSIEVLILEGNLQDADVETC